MDLQGLFEGPLNGSDWWALFKLSANSCLSGVCGIMKVAVDGIVSVCCLRWSVT